MTGWEFIALLLLIFMLSYAIDRVRRTVIGLAAGLDKKFDAQFEQADRIDATVAHIADRLDEEERRRAHERER
jgi:hypothetical protein